MSYKKRLLYAGLVLCIIPLGLATRKMPEAFPSLIAKYGGDIFWALLVYWLFRFLWVNSSTKRATYAAFIFSFCIEISQLFHPEWLENLRATTFGALVLGRGFLWSDFVCYSIGILLGLLFDFILIRKTNILA